MEGLREYVERARSLLPADDIEIAIEFVDNNEWGLAVEHIIDRLSDFDLRIGKEFADETLLWCSRFDLAPRKAAIVRELFSGERSFPTHSTATSAVLDFHAESVEHCVVEGRARGLNDLFIVGMLRKQFGLSFDEAMARVSQRE